MTHSEIKIPDIEQLFSRPEQQTRFPALFNAVSCGSRHAGLLKTQLPPISAAQMTDRGSAK